MTILLEYEVDLWYGMRRWGGQCLWCVGRDGYMEEGYSRVGLNQASKLEGGCVSDWWDGISPKCNRVILVTELHGQVVIVGEDWT